MNPANQIAGPYTGSAPGIKSFHRLGYNNIPSQFIKTISHYDKIGYNINVLQQTACLVVNQLTVCNFAFLFNCTPVVQTLDPMTM